jgi:hypothetical protein
VPPKPIAPLRDSPALFPGHARPWADNWASGRRLAWGRGHPATPRLPPSVLSPRLPCLLSPLHASPPPPRPAPARPGPPSLPSVPRSPQAA